MLAIRRKQFGMRTALYLAACFLLLAPVSCGMFEHTRVSVENVSDSLSYTEDGKPDVTVVFDVDYPDGGDPLMVRGVKQWVGSQLGLTDTTAMAGPDRFSEAFYKQNEVGREMLKNHPNGYRYELGVQKVDETEAYVSFVITKDITDGDQRQTTCLGATLVKPTGKIFGYDMFDENRPRGLAVLVTRGLMEYYQADDFSELVHSIPAVNFQTMDEGVRNLPEASPWIEGSEVVFQYTAGEFSGNVKGNPQARVPYSKAKEFFSADFLRALEEAKK